MPITQILHLQKESGVWIVLSGIQLIVYIVDFWNLTLIKIMQWEREREIDYYSIWNYTKKKQVEVKLFSLFILPYKLMFFFGQSQQINIKAYERK